MDSESRAATRSKVQADVITRFERVIIASPSKPNTSVTSSYALG
jgi:hypothetical protein